VAVYRRSKQDHLPHVPTPFLDYALDGRANANRGIGTRVSAVTGQYATVGIGPRAAKNDDGECEARSPRDSIFIPDALFGLFPRSSARYSASGNCRNAGGGIRTHNIVTSSGATAVTPRHALSSVRSARLLRVYIYALHPLNSVDSAPSDPSDLAD